MLKWVAGVAAGVLSVTAFAVAAPVRSGAVARSCSAISDFDPAWSPNGRTLSFTRIRRSGAVSGVYAVGADGRHERRISSAADYAYGAAWAPEGKRVAYATFDLSAVVRIVVARMDGREARVVASFQDEREPPATFLSWDPDGRLLAYVDSSGNLMAADPEGRTAPHLLARGATEPAWSPDGRKLAYVAPSGITVADTDGGNARTLVSGASPAWSFDSRRIAFMSESGTGVHIIGADGSNDHVVDRRGGFPEWQRSGRALVDTTPSGRAHGTVRVVDFRSGVVRTVTHDASRSFGSDNSQASFSPRTATIGFAGTPAGGHSELRLVGSDGRAERRVTYHCVIPDESSGGRIYGTWMGDIILARNHLRDTIFCGQGHDVALVDRGDHVTACETVRR